MPGALVKPAVNAWPRLTRAALWVFLLCMFVKPPAAHADEAAAQGYQLGTGWQVPDTGFRIGGYATASYERQEDYTPRLALDNFSLFLWWEGDGRWKFFSEIAYENALLTSRKGAEPEDYISLERAYIDYALTDTVNIRTGKFLTPVGRWNLIHATPLVWTTSRPLVTSLDYPTNMTGVMINGELPNIGNGIEYNVYGAHSTDLRTNPTVDPFSSAVGAHVTWTIVPETQVGFSYVDFEQERTKPERKQLFGFDFLWTHNRYELSSEIAYRSSDQGGSYDERGAYIQFVAPLTGKLYAVARYETYRIARNAPTELALVGLNYRLLPGLVFKIEWAESRNNNIVHAPDGLLTSINVLF